MNVAIIGLGRMGCAQAKLAQYFGDKIVFAVDSVQKNALEFKKNFDTPTATSTEYPAFQTLWKNLDLIWITTTDHALANVAKNIADKLSPKTVVLHTSGATPSQTIAQNLPNNPCGSLHPLLPCPPIDAKTSTCVTQFQQAFHTFEGHPEAEKMARILTQRIPASILNIQNKPLYHAAATIAAVYPLTIMQIATELFIHAGFPPEYAHKATSQIMANALKNTDTQSPAKAMTGPAKRGDTKTIQAHQIELEKYNDILKIYNILLEKTQNILQNDN